MHHHHAAQQCHHQRQNNDRGGHRALGKTVQATPDAPQNTLSGLPRLVLGDCDARGFGTHAQVRQRHRNQQQLGEDEYRHTDARGQGQIADHWDVDDDQHRKADDIGQQRGEPGQEQATERVTRRHVLVCTAADVLENAVHLLGAMGDANGEDQERHQNRVGVQIVTQQLHQPQQPDHASYRHAYQQQRAAQATGVEVHEHPGDHYRGTKEQHDRIQTIDQVAHQLAEANDVDADLVALQRANLLFELFGEHAVVQRLAGLRVGIEQRCHEHARLAVVGHQIADDAGACDVTTQGLDGLFAAVVVRWHHRPAIDALFRDLLPAHDGHPQRLHP
ncbi:hypothetical protein D3C76_614940 [compost metagenome]